MFYGLKALGEMENTIFIVTGDHGVVQVCTENPIQRYHIPLILYSPKLKRAKSIKAVNSHYNITPSLLAFLQRDYNLKIPRQLHWMGADFDTTDQVETKIPIPIMQLNRSVEEVAYHDYFLSKGKLFHIANDMQLNEIHNDSIFQTMDNLLKDYLAVNHYVCNHNKLMPEDIYHRWGNIFQFITQNRIPEVLFDSAVDYVSLWKSEMFSGEGNYRIQLDFDLLPTNVEQKDFPEFVLDISNEEGQKLSYNSLSWLREAADFDNSKKNHFSLSIESSIPSEIEVQACSLKAYFWNNREVKLRLENVEVKIYKQKE